VEQADQHGQPEASEAPLFWPRHHGQQQQSAFMWSRRNCNYTQAITSCHQRYDYYMLQNYAFAANWLDFGAFAQQSENPISDLRLVRLTA